MDVMIVGMPAAILVQADKTVVSLLAMLQCR